jgi:hypothetical protein
VPELRSLTADAVNGQLVWMPLRKLVLTRESPSRDDDEARGSSADPLCLCPGALLTYQALEFVARQRGLKGLLIFSPGLTGLDNGPDHRPSARAVFVQTHPFGDAAVHQALDCLVKGENCAGYSLRGGASPSVRVLMTRSINSDLYYNWEFQNSHAPYLAALP